VIPGRPDPQLRAIPAQRGRVLRARAEQGPWIEPVSERWHPDDRRTGGTGSHLAAHAPIRYDGRVVGLLSIDGAGSLEEAALTDAVPALVEFADLAGVLIGQEVGERRELRRMRERIRAIIADAAFRPVFQPIVDLGTDEILGYEALTRFDDGIRPDVLFALTYRRYDQAGAFFWAPQYTGAPQYYTADFRLEPFASNTYTGRIEIAPKGSWWLLPEGTALTVQYERYGADNGFGASIVSTGLRVPLKVVNR